MGTCAVHEDTRAEPHPYRDGFDRAFSLYFERELWKSLAGTQVANWAPAPRPARCHKQDIREDAIAKTEHLRGSSK